MPQTSELIRNTLKQWTIEFTRAWPLHLLNVLFLSHCFHAVQILTTVVLHLWATSPFTMVTQNHQKTQTLHAIHNHNKATVTKKQQSFYGWGHDNIRNSIEGLQHWEGSNRKAFSILRAGSNSKTHHEQDRGCEHVLGSLAVLCLWNGNDIPACQWTFRGHEPWWPRLPDPEPGFQCVRQDSGPYSCLNLGEWSTCILMTCELKMAKQMPHGHVQISDMWTEDSNMDA